MYDHGFVFPPRAIRSGERARFVGEFSRMHRALDGWILARGRLHQLKASTTTDLGIPFSLFWYDVLP